MPHSCAGWIWRAVGKDEGGRRARVGSVYRCTLIVLRTVRSNYSMYSPTVYIPYYRKGMYKDARKGSLSTPCGTERRPCHAVPIPWCLLLHYVHSTYIVHSTRYTPCSFPLGLLTQGKGTRKPVRCAGRWVCNRWCTLPYPTLPYRTLPT